MVLELWCHFHPKLALSKYENFTFGRMENKQTKQILAQINSGGYNIIQLTHDDKVKNYYVH